MSADTPRYPSSEATCILGIDPGVGGAMARYVPDLAIIMTDDFPTYRVGNTERRRLDLYQLSDFFEQIAPAIRCVYMEQVGAAPRQGLSSTFNFGVTYGALQAMCAAHRLPLNLVTPADWKRVTKCPKDKDAARARASAVFPQAAHQWKAKRHDGRAEAALIAWYGHGHLVKHGHA